MAKLVIVESPAKAKTIGKYLGDDYEVTASMGHIRDLPASQLGIDVEHGYTPQYISIKGKEKLIKELKSKAKHADGVLLATDPDREGEEAVKRLREALDDYKKYPLDSVRDGAIQRFEFCTELAWKTMREYLLDQGYTNINSPKEVIKQAFAFGMIEDSKVWLELLNDRNLTSHVYDEATARAIFDRIESQYLPLFDKALAYMQE